MAASTWEAIYKILCSLESQLGEDESGFVDSEELGLDISFYKEMRIRRMLEEAGLVREDAAGNDVITLAGLEYIHKIEASNAHCSTFPFF